jgi:hypothetical protein
VPKYLPGGIFSSTSAFYWTNKQGVAGRFDHRAERMDSTPESKPEEKQEKSYLSVTVESLTPWGISRSSTPKPASISAPGEGSGLKNQHGGDHSTHHWHGLSLKRYPSDCPMLNARWFYAVDVRPIYLCDQEIRISLTHVLSNRLIDSKKKAKTFKGQPRRSKTSTGAEKVCHILRA